MSVGFSQYRANGEWFEERGDLALLTAAIEALGQDHPVESGDKL